MRESQIFSKKFSPQFLLEIFQPMSFLSNMGNLISSVLGSDNTAEQEKIQKDREFIQNMPPSAMFVGDQLQTKPTSPECIATNLPPSQLKQSSNLPPGSKNETSINPLTKSSNPKLPEIRSETHANKHNGSTVFGSQHGWNDPNLKNKDDSIDCSEFRRQKKKRNVTSGSSNAAVFQPSAFTPS